MRLTRFVAVVLGSLLPLGSALAFDHGKLDALLKAHVSGGKVDYEAVRAKEPELDAYLASVGSASGTQPTGFYINAYNAIVLDALIDSGSALPAKVTDLAGFFDKTKHRVAGKELTLNELEGMVRTSTKDARVHFAFNCGARSCPSLRASAWPEDAAALDSALTAATTSFFNGSGLKIDDAKKELQVTRLMEWYADDFKANTGTIEAFLTRSVTDTTKAAALKAAIANGYKVTFQFYNWEPNRK
ncbi:DUF547 domain-containing protein [Deltaproteobacteria bacterium]|nr:DUF547 domain-containing protein [Deltaproteobacteria bacterium]